jgi:hypothetical protein
VDHHVDGFDAGSDGIPCVVDDLVGAVAPDRFEAAWTRGGDDVCSGVFGELDVFDRRGYDTDLEDEVGRRGDDTGACRQAFDCGFPQYTITIDGQNVHFLHVRSVVENATPLIVTHGWQGSIAEFLREFFGQLKNP